MEDALGLEAIEEDAIGLNALRLGDFGLQAVELLRPLSRGKKYKRILL